MKIDGKIPRILLLAAGCVAIMAAVLALTTPTVNGSWGFYLLILLCPAMHFLMHRGLHGGENRRATPPAQLPAPQTEVSADERVKSPE